MNVRNKRHFFDFLNDRRNHVIYSTSWANRDADLIVKITVSSTSAKPSSENTHLLVLLRFHKDFDDCSLYFLSEIKEIGKWQLIRKKRNALGLDTSCYDTAFRMLHLARTFLNTNETNDKNALLILCNGDARKELSSLR